jgi:hypothetical protein
MWGKYSTLREPLIRRARSLGYALAVHGSCKRDLDLIAVPWVEHAANEVTLAEAIFEEIKKVTFAFMPPGPYPRIKPHGRMSWSFALSFDSGADYIDLSVISGVK